LQSAQTRWRALLGDGHQTLVEAFPLTGRKHQIRRHFAQAGHPLVGDARYGKAHREESPELFLHAHALLLKGEDLLPPGGVFTQVPTRFVRHAQSRGLDPAIVSEMVQRRFS
jgi:hypothetical protein